MEILSFLNLKFSDQFYVPFLLTIIMGGWIVFLRNFYYCNQSLSNFHKEDRLKMWLWDPENTCEYKNKMNSLILGKVFGKINFGRQSFYKNQKLWIDLPGEKYFL